MSWYFNETPRLITAPLLEGQTEGQRGFAVTGLHVAAEGARLVLMKVLDNEHAALATAQVHGGRSAIELALQDRGLLPVSHAFVVPDVTTQARMVGIVDPWVRLDELNPGVAKPPEFCNVTPRPGERCSVNQFLPDTNIGQVALWELGPIRQP